MAFITKEDGKVHQPVVAAIILGILVIITVFLFSGDLKPKIDVIIKEIHVPQYIPQEKIVEVTKEPQVINNNYYEKTNTNEIRADISCKTTVGDCPFDESINDAVLRHHAKQKCIEESKKLVCKN